MAVNLWWPIAAVLIVWRACWIVVRGVAAHRQRLAVVAVLLGLWAALGSRDASAVVAWLALGIAAWWVLTKAWDVVGAIREALDLDALPALPSPLSWERWVGQWLRPAWRRWWVYERRWRTTMEEAYLSKHIPMAPDALPEIKRLTTSPFGDTLIVHELIGHTLQKWEDQADVIADAFGARSCNVTRLYKPSRPPLRARRSTALLASAIARSWDPARRAAEIRARQPERECPGMLQLEFATKDALQDPVPAFPIPASSDDVDLYAVPVGITEGGETWTLPVFESHLLIAGITGAGKGSIPWSLLKGLAPAIRDGLVEVWMFDPKGGMELGLGRALAGDRYFSGTIPEMATALAHLVRVMDARTNRLEGIARKLTPTVEDPFVLVIVDEVARLLRWKEDKDIHASIHSSMEQLAWVGRAPGVGLVLSTQNATKEVVDVRDEIPTRVCLRVESPRYVDMILGQGALAQGARADRIRPSLQGAGYARLENRGIVRVRATYIDDGEIRELARDYAPVGRSGVRMEKAPEPSVVAQPPSPANPKGLSVVKAPPAESVDEVLDTIERMAATVDLTKLRPVTRSFTLHERARSKGASASRGRPSLKSNRGFSRHKKLWQGWFMRELDGLGLPRPIPAVGPVRVHAVLTFPEKRTRDAADNFSYPIAKPLGDALTGKALEGRAMEVDGVRYVAGWLDEDTAAEWDFSLAIDPEKGPAQVLVTLTWDEAAS